MVFVRPRTPDTFALSDRKAKPQTIFKTYSGGRGEGGKKEDQEVGIQPNSIFQRILSKVQDQSSWYLNVEEDCDLFHLLSHSSGAFPQASASSVGLWDDPAPAQNEAQLKSRTAPSSCSQHAEVCPEPGQQACRSSSCGDVTLQQLKTGVMDPFLKQSQVPQPQPPSKTSQLKFPSPCLTRKSSEASSQTTEAAGTTAAPLHFMPETEGDLPGVAKHFCTPSLFIFRLQSASKRLSVGCFFPALSSPT